MKYRTLKPADDKYAFYREVLGRPNLTKQEIDRMDTRFRALAEVVLEYLIERVNR